MKTNKAKRLFVAIATMLLLPVVAVATPATLSIEEFTISAGETKEMIIDLNNPSDQITLVQFDLRLPEGLSITLDAGDMIVDIVPGRTTTRKHSISANYQAENNITRVLLSSNTNATFSGTSGAIISISLTASSTFNGGTVKLKNQLLVTPSAVETKPADYSYTISGSAPETLEPYAALSTDHKTLTFYYDKQKTSRGGMSIGLFDDVDRPGWYSYKGEITTVEFDNSFANCNSITSTALWFADLKKLNTIIGIGNLNTSNVEDMSRMFSYCESLTSLDVSNFNTSKVENMDGMFEGCHVISTLDLSNFDTSNVTCMECMFASCSYLSELNLSSFNTSKVTRMDFMFSTCWALTTLDLSGFDTSKVWDMTQMFQHCRNLVSIYVGDGWNVSNVTSSLSMFNDCVSLIGQDGTKYNANAANDATMAHYGTGGYLRNSSDPGYAITIDATNFPDENFRNWVLAQSYGQDGVLTETEIAGVWSIDVVEKNIANLKGVEYFTALVWLSCKGNQLSSLDVSKNTALMWLSCDYNLLTSLDVSKNTALGRLDCGSNQLTSLDVSKNTALTSLGCDRNQLTSLDVSKNTALTELSCGSNQLTSLDVSKNTALIRLYCHSNQLSSLDVSKNTALTILDCDRNQLTSLDVSKNTALTHLGCSQNQLVSLDVSKNTALTNLGCDGNKLTSLDVSKNTALTELYCDDNQLTSLDVSKNTALTELYCNVNQINETEMGKLVTSLPANNGMFIVKELTNSNEQNVITKAQVAAAKAKGWTVYAWDYGQLVEYDGAVDIAINATTFPDENFRNRILAQSYGQDGVLTEAEISSVKDIFVRAENIASLKGIEYFTALRTLYCDYNQLTSLDVSKNTALKELYCGSNQLTSLDVSKNTALTKLFCYSNQLTSLDVSKNTALGLLWCRDNNLVSLDVSKNTALGRLDCGSNQLTSLDVSKNTALTSLGCDRNQLTSLDVSKNTALTELSCGSNQLSSLDVSKNTALTELSCGYNQLSSLDVSKNTALTWLSCAGNQLTSLDVSKNTVLTQLYCDYNQLTSLDVSKNTALTMLDCGSNQLTSLDVSKNTALTELYCGSNHIKETEMGKLVESLPANNGKVYVKELTNSNEQNVITKAQVAAAKAKGWTVYAWDDNADDYPQWVEYDGDETALEPIDVADFGSDIDGNTDLDGNVVGDILYNISSGDGSYNSTEGCIVVTTPTDDSAINGQDIFGEDFQNNFSGIVFMVPAGKGTVKVEAQTTGSMVLKVKIGTGEPVSMELEGRLKVSFPYNVSEPTYVYIYGGAASSAPGLAANAAATGELKLYGVEVVQGETGISPTLALPQGEGVYYDLSGRRVEHPTKGIYIINGKKVVIK